MLFQVDIPYNQRHEFSRVCLDTYDLEDKPVARVVVEFEGDHIVLKDLRAIRYGLSKYTTTDSIDPNN